jgi:hypothetical protein
MFQSDDYLATGRVRFSGWLVQEDEQKVRLGKLELGIAQLTNKPEVIPR